MHIRRLTLLNRCESVYFCNRNLSLFFFLSFVYFKEHFSAWKRLFLIPRGVGKDFAGCSNIDRDDTN